MSLDITGLLTSSCSINSSKPYGNAIYRHPLIADEQISRISAIAHVKESGYTKRDIQKIFTWYSTHLVEQIFKFQRTDKIETIADIGTGCGWLANAFGLKSDARIIAVDFNARAILAAREISEILGISDRIEWCVCSIARLPLASQQIDATFCIEVIEHTGDDLAIIRELARITRGLLVITSPNKIFPVIRHDTGLPCCHWLPPGRLRDWYAAAFGRRASQENNRFWSPRRLLAALPDFEKQSNFLQFRDYHDYVEAEYKCHVSKGNSYELSKAMERCYFSATSWMGANSIYMLPNLASTFRRLEHTVDRGASDPSFAH